MKDAETQEKFVALRARGWTLIRLEEELKVSKPTLIAWSRKFQFQIQNLRTIECENLVDKYLATKEQRIQALALHLSKVEEELAKRNIAEIPTGQLFTIAAALRREIKREAGPIQFTSPISEIPADEYHESVQDWTP